jgi:hypothetical protein
MRDIGECSNPRLCRHRPGPALSDGPRIPPRNQRRGGTDACSAEKILTDLSWIAMAKWHC